MISVVTPFYNEAAILEDAIAGMLRSLETLPEPWELVIVNDGSTDGSAAIAAELCAGEPRLRLISYEQNRGRGHALRSGIAAARGELVFTTEADLSWGETIVHEMYRTLKSNPAADIVIASPHLPKGGYRRVPLFRVLLSRWGNELIRAGLSYGITMNTGMTRGYRRRALDALPLYEDGKEFHLEVVLKAVSLGMRIVEVPAVLEWKEHKLQGKTTKRKSSSKIPRLIGSHLTFSAVAVPVRYFWSAGLTSILISLASGAYGIYRYALEQPYANAVLGFAAFAALGVLLFGFGVISEQNRLLMRDLWRLQVRSGRDAFSDDGAASRIEGNGRPSPEHEFHNV